MALLTAVALSACNGAAQQGARPDRDLRRHRISGLTWAMVKLLGWTKLRAIARVLTEDNAEHWIMVASKHRDERRVGAFILRDAAADQPVQ